MTGPSINLAVTGSALCITGVLLLAVILVLRARGRRT
jgi:hypothetical protein